jgi:hypothetical protein
LPGGPTIDVFWFASQNEDILCEVGWFNLISRAER